MDAHVPAVDAVQGRDPQRVLDVLAKAEEAAEQRLVDVEVWYEQAKVHLADFAATVAQAGERLTTQVESLRGNVSVPGAARGELAGPSHPGPQQPGPSQLGPPQLRPDAAPRYALPAGPPPPPEHGPGTPAPAADAPHPQPYPPAPASGRPPGAGLPDAARSATDHRGSPYAVVEVRGPESSGHPPGLDPHPGPAGPPPISSPGDGIARPHADAVPPGAVPPGVTSNEPVPYGAAPPGVVANYPVVSNGSTGDPVADSIRAYQVRLLADSEQAADRMLVSAEEQAAQMLADARQQADQVMRSAKFHAERMIGNAKMESALTARRVGELRALERKLRESIKGILSGEDAGGPGELDYAPAPELQARPSADPVR